MAQIGFIVHLIAIVEPKIGRAGAGFAISLMTFMAIAGRLGPRHVVDRFDPRLRAAASFASQAAALLIDPADGRCSHGLLAACAVFGCSAGNLITLPPLIIHREFSAATLPWSWACANAISGTIGALGPAFLGLMRGWTGDYGAALLLCIALERACGGDRDWEEGVAASVKRRMG